MRIRFRPTKSMIARWLIGIGIILVASTCFGQEPAPAGAAAKDTGPLAQPIAAARTTLAQDASDANRVALADLCMRRAEYQLSVAGRALDATRRANLTDDARAHLKEAAAALTPALEALKRQRTAFIDQAAAKAAPGQAPADPPKELEVLLQRAWLLDGQTRLTLGELALAAAGNDEAATRAAKKQVLSAITSCSDLEWEYDGWYVAYWSHITQARCKAALGQTGDAFSALNSILALPKDEATAAVRTEAYRRIAELQLAQGSYAEAVATFATAAKDYPELLESRTGQTLHLVAGNAHAKSGRLDKAVAEALKVIEAQRRLRYRAAMDHLAQWAGGWKNAPARVRFLQGDALRDQARATRVPDRYLAAIEAYKAAALGAGRDAATKRYAITGWRAIGSCYEALEQWVEAARAYERGAKRDDLDRPLAAECASRCYQCWRKAVEANPSPTNQDAMRQARQRLIANFPDAKGAGSLGFFAALDLEKASKFLEAAQAYDAVPDDSPKKASAVARAGGCYYREYARRADRAAESKGRLTPRDTALLSEAERRCRRFLEIPDGSPAARGLATYYLGRVAEARGNHARVVELYDGFAEGFSASQPKLVCDVLYLGVRSAVRVPDAAAAERLLAQLLTFAPEHHHCSPALLETAKAVDTEGTRPVRAAELFLQWLAHTPDAGKPAALAVAVRARKVAELLPADDAPEWWSRAAKLLRPLRDDGDGLDEGQRQIVRHSLWKCEAALENWAAAEPLIAELQQATPNSIPLLTARLRCLRALIAAGKADRKARRARLQTVRELVAQYVRSRRQYTPEWWQAKLWQMETFFGLEEYDMVVELIENMRLVAPQMGGPAMRARFLELQKQAKAKRKKR